MPEIRISITNPVVTENPREDRVSSLSKRVFAQLAVRKRNPGKVVPIFVRIDADHKMFGALTLNSGGPVSFFPDFHNLDNFDHLTLSTDFISKGGHLTVVKSDGDHSKFFNIEASLMVNGDYHLITFGMTNGDLLMDVPQQFEIPPVSYATEEEREKYEAWIVASAHGAATLEFPAEEGSYCIQIQVIAKGTATDGMAVEGKVIEKLIAPGMSLEGRLLNTKVTEIPIEDKCDFTIRILTCRIDHQLSAPFAFFMGQR